MDFAICIGLDAYISLSPPTPYAENDAISIYKIFQDIYNVENCQLLLGDKATLRTVEKGIKQVLSKIDIDDRFLLFYAGHGCNFDGIPYLSVYDSDDEIESWISVFDLIERVNKKCKHSLMFIDACQSTQGFGKRTANKSSFDISKLKDRTFESEYCCIFSATSQKGVADIIVEEKHGIFTYFLINALSGKSTDALAESKFLTSNTLKNHLYESLKNHCKKNLSSSAIQVPYHWGVDQAEIIIHEFHEEESFVYNTLPENSKSRLSFVAKRDIRVEDLSDFIKKKHSVPKYYNSSVDSFIDLIAENDIKENIKEVALSLRNLFNLRRLDYKQGVEGASGMFECPYCSYTCNIEIKKQNLNYATMTMRFKPIELNKIYEVSETLDVCFPQWFDFLIYDLPSRLNISSLIDMIEEAGKAESLGLTYDDNDSFEITLGSSRKIKVTESEIEIYFKTQEKIPNMIDGLKEIASQVAQISQNKTLLLD